MTDWTYLDGAHEDEVPHAHVPIRRKLKARMPVASETKAKAAGKATWRSKQASKRVSKMVSGIRNRRIRRAD